MGGGSRELIVELNHKGKTKTNQIKENLIQAKGKTGVGGLWGRHLNLTSLENISERDSWQFPDLTFVVLSIYKYTQTIMTYSISFILIRQKFKS